MRNFLTLYFGFLLISFIFYQKFSVDITFAQQKFDESKYTCIESKNEKECNLDFIFSLIKNNPDFQKKYGEGLVIQAVSGEVVSTKNGDVDIKEYSQQLTKAQLNLFLAKQKQDFVTYDRQNKLEFIATLVILSIRLFGAIGLLWILLKILKAAVRMNFTSIMYICGFISLILAPFTGITVVTAAAFFIIGWIFDSNKN
jgi:hypothetical protein